MAQDLSQPTAPDYKAKLERVLRLHLENFDCPPPIREADRRFHWSSGRRPDDHPGLSDLGF